MPSLKQKVAYQLLPILKTKALKLQCLMLLKKLIEQIQKSLPSFVKFADKDKNVLKRIKISVKAKEEKTKIIIKLEIIIMSLLNPLLKAKLKNQLKRKLK